MSEKLYINNRLLKSTISCVIQSFEKGNKEFCRN